MEELGKALKLWRKSIGLTQEEVAARLGVDRPRYANWEQGRAIPPLETQLLLLDLGMKAIPGMTKAAALVREKRAAYGNDADQIRLLLDIFGYPSQSPETRARARAQIDKLLGLDALPLADAAGKNA